MVQTECERAARRRELIQPKENFLWYSVPATLEKLMKLSAKLFFALAYLLLATLFCLQPRKMLAQDQAQHVGAVRAQRGSDAGY